MEYQGFTGSNYEEDDRERAKHGGSIGGFGRNTLPPGYEQGAQIDQAIKSPIKFDDSTRQGLIPGALNVDSDETEGEHKRLDDINDRMTMRQRVLDSIMEEAGKDPRYAEDFKNNTRTYYNDFLQQYPEYKRLDEEQAMDEDMYKLDPLYDEHEKRRAAEALRMPDAPPPTFNKLNKLIR